MIFSFHKFSVMETQTQDEPMSYDTVTDPATKPAIYICNPIGSRCPKILCASIEKNIFNFYLISDPKTPAYLALPFCLKFPTPVYLQLRKLKYCGNKAGTNQRSTLVSEL
jgi:hypothetical protein